MTIDKKLIRNAQKNIKNFDKVYLYYADRIKNYIRPKVNNDEYIAEDLTSQTFEKALKNIAKFKWQGVSFSAWLYTIANNTLIDYYRKQKNSTELSPEFYDSLKDTSILTEDSLVEKDYNARIKLILESLPDREKEVIILKFYEGLTNKNIANKLGLSETNVGTIVYRAVKKLKEILPPI